MAFFAIVWLKAHIRPLVHDTELIPKVRGAAAAPRQ